MTKDQGRPDLVGRYACRLCRHDQWEHDLAVGCPHCPCMATPGEAGARTDRELDFAILHPSECLPGYSPLQFLGEGEDGLPLWERPALAIDAEEARLVRDALAFYLDRVVFSTGDPDAGAMHDLLERVRPLAGDDE